MSNQSTENLKTYRLTKPKKHHFFGFHDLLISNKKGDKVLSLQVDDIDHPPRIGQKANIGFIDDDSNEFHYIASTTAWNFPQGARLQWVGDTDKIIFNDKVGEDWGARLFDANSKLEVDNFPYPIHVLDADSMTGFSINYSRLHRLGGYGYIGFDDKYKDAGAPIHDGINKINLITKRVELIVSIADIANFEMSQGSGHHYLTHLSLNPSCTRIAFLHRYRLEDGGEMTRLMTLGVDGSDLKCLILGFLSHFDWKKDGQILIWGRKNQAIANLRDSKLLSNSVLSKVIKLVKPIVRKLIGSSNIMSMHFMLVNESNQQVEQISHDVINSDGHPMINPINRDWMINDTYPDKEGVRFLMLYNFKTNTRVDLGKYRMLDKVPNAKIVEEFSLVLDPSIRSVFKAEQYAFTRSGLHCDLHPRWLADGKSVAFDSIHEGMRQIYIIDVSNILEGS